MNAALFSCPRRWSPWVPDGVLCPGQHADLAGTFWDLLVLTPDACARPVSARCQLLLLPGDCPGALRSIQAGAVASYGLSLRDSLTLSSLAEPVLCLQRAIPRPGLPPLEPQEIPLPPLPEPADSLLPLLGLRLLLGRL